MSNSNIEAGDDVTPESVMDADGRCFMQAPFWYPKDKAKGPRPTGPVGNMDDLAVYKLQMPLLDQDWLVEMNIEKPERYLPGEIYKNVIPKEPVIDLSKSSTCNRIWKPKDPQFFNSSFDPNSLPPIDYYLFQKVRQREKLSLAVALRTIESPKPIPDFGVKLPTFPPSPKKDEEKSLGITPSQPETLCPCGCGYTHEELVRMQISGCPLENATVIRTPIPNTNPYCYRNSFSNYCMV